jgi:hypothetical protein
MNSFNPSRYSSDSDMDVSDEVVEKGHKNILKVDLDKFEILCKKFKEKKELKIKNLTDQDKEDFDLVVSYVHLLYGTEYYNTLYDIVKKYFKTENVKPGTIGGYFSGCMNSKNTGNIETGCSLACAGSMPVPKEEEDWASCDSAVIMGEKENGNYIFSLVKPGEDTESAYVFVESNSFDGFTQYEKENLKALGCKNVKLIGYTSDMNYSEFYKDSKPVNEIKHRHIRHVKKHSKNNNWLLIIVIFIILLIILGLLKYYFF